MRAIPAVFLALALASPVLAEEGVARTDGAKPLNWSRIPSWAEMQAVYPAMSKAASGFVLLRCTIGPAGELADCKSSAEKPGDQGFSQAALSLAPLFAASPGHAGETVELPFNFLRPGRRDARTLLNPKWVHAMSLDEAKGLFPAKAGPSVTQGAAAVQCKVTTAGLLQPCVVLSEAPKDQGFGEAALQTAARMAMNPWSEGYPVEGLGLTFRLSFVR